MTQSALLLVGMKPLSERDENEKLNPGDGLQLFCVGMKPLSERDENVPEELFAVL